MTPTTAFAALWGGFGLSWLLASRWSAPTGKRADPGVEAPYRLLQVAGFALLFVGPRFAHDLPEWSLGATGAWIAVGVAALGFAFCWWARLHLGRLWSASVERKGDHRVVDTGPYRFVRHPIYTGALTAAFATALAIGSPIALLGACTVTLAFWIKARLEERFLRAELGAEAYGAYARRTRMLVPFVF